MCGIVGYIGNRNAVRVLVKGLEHLEYRGYDSAGIACLNGNKAALSVIKERGKLARLKSKLRGSRISSHLGIGHTRWATHGEPSEINAHPHTDTSGRMALVHNGIIENYGPLKAELLRKGFRFKSETDTEVVVNLISSYYRKGNLVQAVRQAVKRLEGFFAFVLMTRDSPDELLVFKRSNPLVVGFGNGETFVASDVSALLPYTNRVLYLEDDEYALIRRDGVRVFQLSNGREIKRKSTEIHWTVAEAQKGGYPHYMLKEIFEQPKVLEGILSKRIDKRHQIVFDPAETEGIKKLEKRMRKFKKVYLVSCGTAYHAGFVAHYMIGKYARITVEAAVSSEFRYEKPELGEDDLVILITQSGETADTLAALRIAKEKGKKPFTLAIVNVVGSTIAREADAVIYTYAGPEISVASTKAYTAQLATLALFALHFAYRRRKISARDLKKMVFEFKKLPNAGRKVLKQDSVVGRCAKKLGEKKDFLFIGRGYDYPTALEGALKLNEISYKFSYGYPAGELKHGPIALIDETQPVICIAPETSLTYPKMISNIEEIRARGGIIVAVGMEGDGRLKKLSDYFFAIPKTQEFFLPILTVIPLQLFAYKVAVLNGQSVDQPRNLAKSVTVE